MGLVHAYTFESGLDDLAVWFGVATWTNGPAGARAGTNGGIITPNASNAGILQATWPGWDATAMAGKMATLSFWLKGASAGSGTWGVNCDFHDAGTATVYTWTDPGVAVTTSWQQVQRSFGPLPATVVSAYASVATVGSTWSAGDVYIDEIQFGFPDQVDFTYPRLDGRRH